jgi:hypothetical protein
MLRLIAPTTLQHIPQLVSLLTFQRYELERSSRVLFSNKHSMNHSEVSAFLVRHITGDRFLVKISFSTTIIK